MTDFKGHVLINREIVHTILWPGEQITLHGVVDMEKEYKESLAGAFVPVMDISVDDKEYLVLGTSKSEGQFLWSIDKRDVKAFVPVIKKYGIIIPADLTPLEEFEFLAKSFNNDKNKK